MGARQGGGGGKEVPEGGGIVRDAAGGDVARPAGDLGDSEAAFAQGSFYFAEAGLASEPRVVGQAAAGAVVAGEEDYRVVVEVEFFESGT